MNNLTEGEVEFDVNSGFDESSFGEILGERVIFLASGSVLCIAHLVM